MRLPARRALGGCAAFIAAMIALSCGAFVGTDASSDSDASANGGGNGEAGASADANGASEGGSGSDGASCAIVYVDGSKGHDTNDGCTPATATLTIGAGIARAKSAGAGEVRVCEGSYQEGPLVIDAPISLLGSFTCGTFTRAAPTADAGALVGPLLTPTTKITATQTVVDALLVTGPLVVASTRIDGLDLTGSSAPNARAVHVTAQAAPTLTNLVATGGSGASTVEIGSIGVLIDEGAAPALSHVEIHGGGGTGATEGSVGVAVIAPSPDAGAPSGTVGIERSRIEGGHGSTIAQPVANTSSVGSVGVFVAADGRVHLLGNHVTGGSGSCPNHTSACALIGVLAEEVPTINVSRNAIWAGDPSSTNKSGAIGFYATNTTPVPHTAVIHENMIVAGGASVAYGVELDNTANASVVNNTIVGQPTLSNTWGLALSNATGTNVYNNLFASVTTALELENATTCMNTLVFDDNAIVETSYPLSTQGCNDINDGSISYVIGLSTYFTAVGNARVATTGTCPSEDASLCFSPSSCTTGAQCYADTFATTVISEDNLFTMGIALGADPWCGLTKGGSSSTSIVDAVDYYGNARGNIVSIGAQQFDGTCQ
jgi:hypothetical protein